MQFFDWQIYGLYVHTSAFNINLQLQTISQSTLTEEAQARSNVSLFFPLKDS